GLSEHVAPPLSQPGHVATGRGGNGGAWARRVDDGPGAERAPRDGRPGARAPRGVGNRAAARDASRDGNLLTRRLPMLREKEIAQSYVAEERYPLPLQPVMPDVWELWQRSKTLEWDPQTAIPSH